MTEQWWWNSSWRIRDNEGLQALFDIGDTLTLVPNTAADPSFFWIRFEISDPAKSQLWKGSYVYAVGAKSPSTSLKHAWDDSKAKPGDQDTDVKADFDRETRHVHSIADDPNTAKLEGHIRYKSHWAIIRVFCFSKAQSDGKDWFAIDSSYMSLLDQDGTGHGDPPK